MKLIHRCCLNLSLLMLVTLGLLAFWQMEFYSLLDAALFSGWLLFTLFVLLFLLTLRKRIVGGSFIKVSTWLQLHIYMGLLAAIVFFLHTGLHYPEGLLKQCLYVLFITEVLSGLFGLFISRWLPPYLARSGHVLYQDIIAQQQQICEQVERLVKHSLQQTESNTIADFFQQHLLSFFIKPQNFWAHLLQSKKTTHGLEVSMDNLQRYLNQDERQIIQQIHALLIEKDQLDYQYAGQSLLKRWLFVHIPVSYALLLFVLLHLTLVYAYIGGW